MLDPTDKVALLVENDNLKTDQKALLDMLTETYLSEKPAEIKELGVPDWVTMAHSLAKARVDQKDAVEKLRRVLNSDRVQTIVDRIIDRLTAEPSQE